jgi:hypothetical protein
MLLFAATLVTAQTKKPAPGKAAKTPTVQPKDTVVVTEEPETLPTEFKVYSKRSKTKKERMKLCLNLINGDSILNYCVNDSLLNDPENTKILFQEKTTDSTYFLVYVGAFTKDPNRMECSAGREVKLFFVRASLKTNKAIVKQKYIESCQKTITRMNREPIDTWDGQSVLKVSYHRGSVFHDVIFDPQNYRAGLQSISDAENK